MPYYFTLLIVKRGDREGIGSPELSLDALRSCTVLRRERGRLEFILCWENAQWDFRSLAVLHRSIRFLGK